MHPSIHRHTHTHSFARTDTTKATQIIREKYLHLSAYVSRPLSLSLSLSLCLHLPHTDTEA